MTGPGRSVVREGIVAGIIGAAVVAIWFLATATGFALAALSWVVSFPVASIAAIPVAAMAVGVPMYLYGGVVAPLSRAPGERANENNIRTNGILTMASMACLLLLVAGGRSWIRFVAWQFFAVLALNGIAALALLALRPSIERAEAEAGGRTSAF